MFCCPLCEESTSNCECGFGPKKENDKSITLSSEDDRLVCGACGVVTRNCLCNFQHHNLKGINDRLIHMLLVYSLIHNFHENGFISITMFLDCA